MTPAEQQQAQNGEIPGTFPGTKKIGNYYFGYSHANAACDNGTTTQEEQIAKAQPDTDISKIFDTIEAVPQ